MKCESCEKRLGPDRVIVSCIQAPEPINHYFCDLECVRVWLQPAPPVLDPLRN